jgi:hypothetical protein
MMQTSARTSSPIHERILPVKPNYEPGMKIQYDPTSQRVIVAFRGKITVLPDTYDSEEKGIKAGEAHCHRHGWKPQDHGKTKKAYFKSWF